MDGNNGTNLTPKLRFPGFEGDWEEKKLREVAIKVNTRNKKLSVSRVLTNSASEGIIDQSDYFDRDIAVKENTENYHIVEKGDFVYNPRISTSAPVGPISRNKIGCGIMSPLYTVFRFNNANVLFMEYYFSTTIWHPYLKSVANFGARFDRMNITTDNFLNMPLSLPSLPEQQKIAECLSAVDESILAQQEKVDALKARKKGLMQQLFPQDSETSPRLRFPGFSGEWEEKKLGEVAKKSNIRNRQLKVSRILSNSATEGIINQSDYFDRNIAIRENTENYHVVEIDDFVYNPRISVSAPVGPISRNKVGKGIMSPLYTIFKFFIGYVSFYEYYFGTTIWYSYLKSIANFGARFDRMNITNEGFFNMPILLPVEFAEQKKIADFLSVMDDTIIVEKQKLDALIAHKKGLMQQLFPQPSK